MNTEQQVGAHLGFSIVNELKKKQLNVQEVTTTEQLFQMLQLGRLPVVAVQDTTAQQFLSSKKNQKHHESRTCNHHQRLLLSV